MNRGQEEAEPLRGVSWAESMLRAAPYWVTLALLGGAVGLLFGASRSLPYVSTAVLAVGEFWESKPLEPPINVAQRIEGYGRELGDVAVIARPRLDRRYQGRIIDVRAESEDPELARRVLDDALSRLVELHASFAAFENRTNEQFVELSERRARVLQDLLETTTPEAADVIQALLAARRGQTDLGIPVGGAIVPGTRVLRRASPAAQGGSRAALLGLSGALGGALLGIFVFWARHAWRASFARDPRLRVFPSLVMKTVLAGGLAGAMVGGARVVAASQWWLARAVVLTGHLGGTGSIHETDDLIESLRQSVEDARPNLCSSESCDLQVDLLPIRATPSDDVKTQLIEIRAKSADREIAARAVEHVVDEIDAEQRPAFEENYDRYRRHIQRIRRDLERIEAIEDQSRVDQEHIFALMREYTTHERNLSPARSYPPERLGPTSFEQRSDAQLRAALALVLTLLGALLGLVLSFGWLGWERVRQSSRSR